MAPLTARLPEVMWVLNHQRDLDADFLACYGIDLEVDEISGPRYLALASRVPAYGGVMASRQEEQQEQRTDRGVPPAPAAAAPSRDGEQHMELVAFRVAFPGMVSMASVEGGDA